jgi:tetratricopeptide (TPR) repeat protein
MLAIASGFSIPNPRLNTWCEMVRSFLENMTKPWLLVLDDACASSLEIVDKIIPKSGKGLILINTCLHPDGYITNFDPLAYGNLSIAQAVALLKHITKDTTTEDSIFEQIATHVNCLPFAISLIGTYIRRLKGSFPPARYLKYLENQPSVALKEKDESDRSVFGIISTSIDQVQKEFVVDGEEWTVQDTLRLLSFFLPENIPLNVMPFDGPAQDVDDSHRRAQTAWVQQNASAILGTYPCAKWSESRWQIMKGLLKNYHLLDIVVHESHTTYSMHSLILKWAKHSLYEQEDYARWRTTASIILASARQFNSKTAPERAVLLTRIMPHWESCRHDVDGADYLSSEYLTKGSVISQEEPGHFLKQVWSAILHLSGSPRQCNVTEDSVVKARAILDLHFERIEIFKACGRSMSVLNDCRRVLERRLQFYVRGDKAVLASRSQLGECLEDAGNYNEALIERQVVVSYTRLDECSTDHFHAVLDEAKSLDKLGLVHDAYILLQKLSEALNKDRAYTETQTLTVQKRYANVCQRLGYFEEARELRETLLKRLQDKDYSKTHAEVLDAKTNLALSYSWGTDEQKKQAMRMQKEVLDSQPDDLPDDHPRILLAQENYACTLIRTKKDENIKQALKILEKTLEHRSKHQGEHSAFTTRCRIKHAVCFIRIDPSKNLDDGCLKLEQVLADLMPPRTKIDDETRLLAMEELAGTYLRYKKTLYGRLYWRALAMYIFIYETKLGVHGSGNRHMHIHTRHVAEALEKLGCWQSALPFRIEVSRLSGHSDADRLCARCRLATNLSKSPHTQHQKAALELFEGLIPEINQHRLSDLRDDLKRIYFIMPYVYLLFAQGRFEEAVPHIQSLRETNDINDETAGALLEDCRSGYRGDKDSIFHEYQALFKNEKFETKKDEQYLGSPLLLASSYIGRIFHWEAHALASSDNHFDIDLALPSKLPWQMQTAARLFDGLKSVSFALLRTRANLPLIWNPSNNSKTSSANTKKRGLPEPDIAPEPTSKRLKA